MNFFKKLLLSIVVSLASLAAFADTAVIVASGTNSLYSGPIRLLSITVSATTNIDLKFYDSPYLTNTIYVGSNVTYAKIVATTNFVYTNVFGVVSTNIYSVIRSSATTNASGLKTRELIYAGSFISNTTPLQVIFEKGKYLQGGLMLTNLLPGSPVTVSIEYDKLE